MSCTHDELVRILRGIINDLDKTLYTDDRLLELLCVSAQLLVGEVSFSQTYTIHVMKREISPNPLSSPRDNTFVNMLVMKAACIMDKGKFRTDALKTGVRIVNDKSLIDTTKQTEAYKVLLEQGYCKTYELIKAEYLSSRSSQYGEIILGPFKSQDGFPHFEGGYIWQ